MGRNEIRLRRNKMTAGSIHRHRNYAHLMQRHKRDLMIKQALRFLVFFLVIVLLMILSFVAVNYVRNKAAADKAGSSSAFSQPKQ